MAVTREMIEAIVKKINDAENSRPNTSVENTIAMIEECIADDAEGFVNGTYIKEYKKLVPSGLYTQSADYHRKLNQVIIDPPVVAFTWLVTGTFGDTSREIHGCTVGEINEGGLFQRFWIYLDRSQSSTK